MFKMSEPPSTDGTASVDASAESSLSEAEASNPRSLCCQRCASKILLPNCATSCNKKVFLPSMTFKASVSTTSPGDANTELLADPSVQYVVPGVAGEVVEAFWLVRGMYTFENVGVSHTVKGIKYLTCADCEVGPVGFHEITNRDDFFVAKDRVADK